jgi:hypothetical protein
MNVYFSAGDGAVYECAIGGCNNKPTQLASNTSATAIAVDATTVYWGSDTAGSVVSCLITGCNGTPTTLASGQDFPLGMALDAANAYWTTAGDSDGATGTVMKCPKAGCNNSPTVLASGLPTPSAIAVDAHYVYWLEGNSNVPYVLRAAPITGGQAITVVPVPLNGAPEFALSDSCVYFSGGLGSLNVIAKP